MDCIFCKIIRKEIPSDIVYENQATTAFLDISPNNPGHTLVVPKKHYETILDLPEQDGLECLKTIKKVSRAVMESLKADGFNVAINNFSAAGQEVKHAHFHIIPRFNDDGLKHWPPKDIPKGEMDNISSKIRTFLK